MLTEGWDCNTVTHVVGLRPFMSQLLCEQVVGRALRRASYEIGEGTIEARLDSLETRMTNAETSITANSSLETSRYNITVTATKWVSEAATTISPSEDYDGHPAYVKGLKFHYVSEMSEVLEIALMKR